MTNIQIQNAIISSMSNGDLFFILSGIGILAMCAMISVLMGYLVADLFAPVVNPYDGAEFEPLTDTETPAMETPAMETPVMETPVMDFSNPVAQKDWTPILNETTPTGNYGPDIEDMDFSDFSDYHAAVGNPDIADITGVTPEYLAAAVDPVKPVRTSSLFNAKHMENQFLMDNDVAIATLIEETATKPVVFTKLSGSLIARNGNVLIGSDHFDTCIDIMSVLIAPSKNIRRRGSVLWNTQLSA